MTFSALGWTAVFGRRVFPTPDVLPTRAVL
jgi:hypothetical protein